MGPCILYKNIQTHWGLTTRYKGQLIIYTAIFLTNGLCIVYCSLPEYLTLVYLGWGQKSEVFLPPSNYT